MIWIAAALLVLAAVVFFVGLAIGGNVIRIAQAVEAQNAHYGVGEPVDPSLLGIPEPQQGAPVERIGGW